MSEFGIPYMGSKDKIAKSICMKLPKADHFYDLFGGGFSMTHCMISTFPHKYKKFHYNEIKEDVVDLVKKAIAGEFSYKRFQPPWISREEFFSKKDSDAYIRCIWSFGNDQKTYLFGKDNEQIKKSMHMAIVFNEFNDFAYKVLGFNEWPIYVKTIKQKRFFLRQKISFDIKNKKIQQENVLKFSRLDRLQQLEQLQQLERLQHDKIDGLNFYSGSYLDVPILPNSLVYCDIPYEGTRDYGNSFNRKQFLGWASNADFPVYISEYNVSDSRFKCVYEIEKRSLLCASKENTLIKTEKLYWNGK